MAAHPKQSKMDALGEAQRFQDGPVTYVRRYSKCSNPRCKRCATAELPSQTHGPYWYLIAQLGKRTWTAYIGKTLDTRKFRREDGTFNYDAYAHRQRSTEGRIETDSQSVPKSMGMETGANGNISEGFQNETN